MICPFTALHSLLPVSPSLFAISASTHDSSQIAILRDPPLPPQPPSLSGPSHHTSCFLLSSSCSWLHSCPSAGGSVSHLGILNWIYPQHSIPGHHKHHFKDRCTEHVTTFYGPQQYIRAVLCFSRKAKVTESCWRSLALFTASTKKKNVDESSHTLGKNP